MHAAVTTVQHAIKQRLLERQQRQHAFFDAALAHKVDHLHTACLPHAVHAADALFQHSGVPGQVHIDDHGRCVLQVQAHATGVGGQEEAAVGVAVKPFHQCAALFAGHAAVEQHMAPVFRA